jgi:metallo-beta-lactamase family protein
MFLWWLIIELSGFIFFHLLKLIPAKGVRGVEIFALVLLMLKFFLFFREFKNKFICMTIKFCGAAGDVTGSAHLITMSNGFRILLDCGMFQGDEDVAYEENRNWYFNPEEVDCVILSHAHIDHCGRLPKLVKDGFAGNIFSTPATRSLSLIMLLDSAKIQEYDAQYERKINKKGGKIVEHDPLYDTEDVYNTLAQFVTVNYNRWHGINKHVSFLFKDAGHILGSASVTLKIKDNDQEYIIGFTGDIGRPSRPIIRDPQIMPEVDYLICESTYGGRSHEEAPNEFRRLREIINRTCVENKGKLIIPAFSLGRTQEIVYMMDRMANDGTLPKIPVYVDSPLSVNATRIFRLHPECYDNELKDYIEFDPDPFGFNGLYYITEVEGSKKLNHLKGPAIIISAAGMANAGRVRHHLANNMENPNNTILIVGYCAPGTLGDLIRNRVNEVRLFGETRQLVANVEIMDSFSAHADEQEMISFISNQKDRVRKVFLVHGNNTARKSFVTALKNEGFKEVLMPGLNELIELD